MQPWFVNGQKDPLQCTVSVGMTGLDWMHFNVGKTHPPPLELLDPRHERADA